MAQNIECSHYLIAEIQYTKYFFLKHKSNAPSFNTMYSHRYPFCLQLLQVWATENSTLPPQDAATTTSATKAIFQKAILSSMRLPESTARLIEVRRIPNKDAKMKFKIRLTGDASAEKSDQSAKTRFGADASGCVGRSPSSKGSILFFLLYFEVF